MYMARTFMVHASLHWMEHGVDDISLWPFAVKHAVRLHNRVPNRESGLTPMELITKQKADHYYAHTCGVVLPTSLSRSFRTVRSCLSGIGGLVLVNFWGIPMNILHWWLIFGT